MKTSSIPILSKAPHFEEGAIKEDAARNYLKEGATKEDAAL